MGPARGGDCCSHSLQWCEGHTKASVVGDLFLKVYSLVKSPISFPTPALSITHIPNTSFSGELCKEHGVYFCFVLEWVSVLIEAKVIRVWNGTFLSLTPTQKIKHFRCLSTDLTKSNAELSLFNLDSCSARIRYPSSYKTISHSTLSALESFLSELSIC